MTCRAVFFDLAGTLIAVRGGLGGQYAAVAAEFGLRADPRAIDKAFPGAFAAAGPMVFARPDAALVASLEKGFWKGVVRRVFSDIGMDDQMAGDRFDAYFERLFHHFEGAEAWTVFPDVRSTLGELRARGLVIGLITNFDYRVFPLVNALGLAPLVDSITIPAIAGAAKPDRRIFEHAAAGHGVQPADAVQVGDSIRDDVEGARAAGMMGVLLDRKNRHPSIDGLPRIASLEALASLLPLG